MSSPAPFENRATILIKIATGTLITAAGLFAFYDWHVGKSILAAYLADLPQVHYLSAACLVLTGAAIATSACRNQTISLFFPAILVFVAVFEAFDKFIGLPLDTASVFGFEGVSRNQIHTTPIGTVTFLFIGLALIFQKKARKHGPIIGGSLGAFAFSCGIASTLGFWAGYGESLEWGGSTEISLPGALAFSIAGAVIILGSRSRKIGSNLSWKHYIPVAILSAGLTVSFTVRQSTHLQEVASVNSTVALELLNVKGKVEAEVMQRLVANERMAERWAEHGSLAQTLWENDAKRYFKNPGGYQSLEWVDAKYNVRQIFPSEPNRAALGVDLANTASSRKALEKSKTRRKTLFSLPVELDRGGTGILVSSPIFKDAEFKGFILSVFRTQELFGRIIPANIRARYSVAIVDNQNILYSTDAAPQGNDSKLNQVSSLDLGGSSFLISIRPNEETLAGMTTKGADVVLLLGTLISLLLAGSVLLAQRARRHNAFIIRTNELLTSEIEGRKRIETILRETSTFRKAILNGANCMIISTDCEGLITSFNRTAEYLLGYAAEEVIGLHRLDHFHDKVEIESYNRELSKRYGYNIEPGFESLVIRTRDRIADEREWSYKCKNGSRFPVALSVTAIEDEFNQITGYLAIGRDNSQLYNTSRRLLETEERFKAVVNNTPALVYIKDQNGRFVFSNNKFEALLQLEPGDLIGKTVYDITDKATADGVWEIENRVLSTGVPEESSELVLLGDKPLAHYLFVRFMIPSMTQENCLGVIAIDLSPQLEVEEELRAANRAAVESSRLKSEFLANMSHEIRTPMNGVLGMLEVLLETKLNSSQREYAEVIQDSAKTLLAILDDILDFSRLEAGKLSFETIEFDLRSTIENTVAAFAESAESKGIEIASLIEQDVPTSLLGDPGRLRQILTNLIGNAVKFTERGEVQIRVSNNNCTGKKAKLLIEIEDTGIGINEGAQKHLFEAFVQADGSMVRRYGGTGLGLSISKQLVELMDGEISVESQPGEGSVFRFTAEFDIHEHAEIKTPPVGLLGLRALIADDLITNRKSISYQLQALGFETVEASSGEECIDILKSEALHNKYFDIVVLDHEMPGLDGLETSKVISLEPDLNQTKIILMPVNGRRYHAHHAMQSGISAFLNKPIRQVELFECIATLMSGVTPTQFSDTEAEWLGDVIAQQSLPDVVSATGPPILIATGDVKNQGILSMQLELLGHRSQVVSDGHEALAALKKRSYLLILMDLDLPGIDGITTASRIRNHLLEEDVPIIGIAADLSDDRKKAALDAGIDGIGTLPMSEELLSETISEYLNREPAQKEKTITEIEPSQSLEQNAIEDPSVKSFVRELVEKIGPEMAEMNFSLFAEDADCHIAEIRSCAKESNYEGLVRLAGSLLLVCETLRAVKMQDCCRDLNQSATAEDADGVSAAVEDLEAAFSSVIAQLEQFSLEPSFG